MPTSNAWSSASLNDPTVPTPYLRSIYNSVPADPSIGQSLNGDQVITLWREVRTALDAIDASRIATQNSANEINNLQVELDAARTEEDILHDKIHVQENELISLRAKVISLQPNANNHSLTSPVLSNEHPDPSIFDGSQVSLLPDFLLLMTIKLNVNADRYPNRVSRLAYFISRLAGGALKQVKFGITERGDFTFKDVDEVVQLLKTAYGDHDPQATASTVILSLKQHKQPLQQFLPEWHRAAIESGFDDKALTALLKDALHPVLLDRLSFNSASFSTTSLPAYLTLVRETDSVLRMLQPNYHKTKHGTTNGKPTPEVVPVSSLPSGPALTTSNGGDAMDLSLVWTGSMGGKRRPKNDAERRARRKYCFDNNLCLFCESPDHRISDCRTRPENKRQPGRSVEPSPAVVEENL